MRPKRRRTPYRKIFRTTAHDLLLGFAWLGFTVSILPPDVDWFHSTEVIDWLERNWDAL
jgi:hypothetical protein